METDRDEDRAKNCPFERLFVRLTGSQSYWVEERKRERSWWNRFYERTINYDLSKQDYQPLATSTVFALYTSSSMQVQYTRFAPCFLFFFFPSFFVFSLSFFFFFFFSFRFRFLSFFLSSFLILTTLIVSIPFRYYFSIAVLRSCIKRVIKISRRQ